VIVWELLGWTGNVCFFSRFLVQWWASERAQRSVAPLSFWWLSLVGTITLGAYALHARTYVLLVGYALNGLIYLRNLRFHRQATPGLSSVNASLIALAAGIVLVVAATYELRHRHESSLIWIIVAGVGQAIWSSRFVVQWWASERAAESHFPALFWWLSLAGNALLLAFTIHLGNPVLIAGYVPGPLVQVRNLMLGKARSGRRAGC